MVIKKPVSGIFKVDGIDSHITVGTIFYAYNTNVNIRTIVDVVGTACCQQN